MVAHRNMFTEKRFIAHDSVTLKHSSLSFVLSFSFITGYMLWSLGIGPCQRHIKIEKTEILVESVYYV